MLQIATCNILSGSPFTNCGSLFPPNFPPSLLNVGSEVGYREHDCLSLLLAMKVCDKCGCFLNYGDVNFNQEKMTSFCKPCNFVEHAQCAAEVRITFEWSHEICLPSCSSNVVKTKYIQVRKPPHSFMSISRKTFIN